MKIFLTLIILFLSLGLNAQNPDTTRTPTGYEINYAHICVKVDTVHHMSQLYNYTGKKVYISINGGKESLLVKNQVMTVWGVNFQLTVTSKKITKTYRI